MRRRVLISGGGVAGFALAYWLHRWGFIPTVVERAPTLREGGYVIDFFGLGYEVAERMGVIERLRRHDLRVGEVAFVDDLGRRRAAVDMALVRELMDERLCSLPRASLARVLYDVVKENVEVVFGDEVTELGQHGDAVDVVFQSGVRRAFHLVAGADGLHSRIRRLCFAAHDELERFLGYYTASFTFKVDRSAADEVRSDVGTANTGDAPMFASHTVPGRQVGVYPLDPERCAAFFAFRSPPLAFDRHDAAAQVAILRRAFEGVGWRTQELLERAEAASDVYFDAVSQVRMPAWSKERVVLVGDACGCPSLLSGQGASLAMAGAYVLAGELNAAAGGHRSAYSRYEQLMRPHVEDRQARALRFASSFLPSSTLGVFILDMTTRLLASRRVADWFVARFMRGQTGPLPRYE